MICSLLDGRMKLIFNILVIWVVFAITLTESMTSEEIEKTVKSWTYWLTNPFNEILNIKMYILMLAAISCVISLSLTTYYTLESSVGRMAAVLSAASLVSLAMYIIIKFGMCLFSMIGVLACLVALLLLFRKIYSYINTPKK